MLNQRGALSRCAAASAAFVAALVSIGASAPANAATLSAAPQVAAAFPTRSFFIKNPSQQAKCLMPTVPSFLGPLTIQPCGDINQYFSAFVFDGQTELIPLWSDVPDGVIKCLGANSAGAVYTSPCDGAINRNWQLVGRTVRNRASGMCLSANSANAVYTATCDGAINRNWVFPTSAAAADVEAVRAVGAARRAQLAAAKR